MKIVIIHHDQHDENATKNSPIFNSASLRTYISTNHLVCYSGIVFNGVLFYRFSMDQLKLPKH